MSAENHSLAKARFTAAEWPPLDVVRPALRDDERAMIVAAANGRVTRQIASEFFVCQRTVEYRLQEAAAALGAQNRPHLVAVAIRSGLVAPVASARLSYLTARELLIVQALSEGFTIAAIASQLPIGESAVSARIKNAKLKSAAKTREQLAAMVASQRLDAERLQDARARRSGEDHPPHRGGWFGTPQ